MKYRYFTAVHIDSGQHRLFRRGIHPNYYRLSRFMPHSKSRTLTNWTIHGLKSHWKRVGEITEEEIPKYIMLMELVK
jgi:hypothetical protein